MTTPHLVESLKKFLKWAIDFSNLEFSMALHLRSEQDCDRSEEDICHELGQMHYHLIFYSTKFPKTMDKIVKKNFNLALTETMGPDNSYKVEMFSTSRLGFRREFLRQTKTLLTHGTTIQLRLSAIKQSNFKSNIDCIWEKSQMAASTKSSTFNKAGVLEQLEQLEKSPSQFKHAVPD